MASERVLRFAVLALLLGLTSGQGCLGPGNPGPSDGNGDDGVVAATVNMLGQRFSPQSVTIGVGQAVHWSNEDTVIHTVTSGNPDDADEGALFDSGSIPPGGGFNHTFNEPGTFRYHCEFHPETMRDATVVVE